MSDSVNSLRCEKRLEHANSPLKRLVCSWFSPILFVPIYLLGVCLFLNISNSVSFNIPLLESIFRPFPEDRLIQSGLALLFVDLVRVFICRKLRDNGDNRAIAGILPLFVFASFMTAAGFLFWSNIPSHEERARYNAEKSCSNLARGAENGTVYENGRCSWAKDIKYVDESIEVQDIKKDAVQRNESGQYVKGVEVTVDAGVFDGKEYKNGDKIFFEDGSSKLDKYQVIGDYAKELAITKSYKYKWDVETTKTGSLIPSALNIDGKNYDRKVEVAGWEALKEPFGRRVNTSEAYMRSE